VNWIIFAGYRISGTSLVDACKAIISLFKPVIQCVPEKNSIFVQLHSFVEHGSMFIIIGIHACTHSQRTLDNGVTYMFNLKCSDRDGAIYVMGCGDVIISIIVANFAILPCCGDVIM